MHTTKKQIRLFLKLLLLILPLERDYSVMGKAETMLAWQPIVINVLGLPIAARIKVHDYIGESARLECPMYYGAPYAKITWNLPSGVTF